MAKGLQAAPSAFERIEGAIERTRERLPTFTTALLIVVFAVGAGVGVVASKPWHRAEVNKEWRARLASEVSGIRKIVAQGDKAAEALDNEIIAELGVYDERLSVAEQGLENASRNVADGACRIPAWRMRD